jgi:hypothetical protein
MSYQLNDEPLEATVLGTVAAVVGTGPDISVFSFGAGNVTVSASNMIVHTPSATLGSTFTTRRRGRFHCHLIVPTTGAGAQGMTLGISLGASGASLTGLPTPGVLGMLATMGPTLSGAGVDFGLQLTHIVTIPDSVVGLVAGTIRFHGTQNDGTTLVGGDLVEANLQAQICFISDNRT